MNTDLVCWVQSGMDEMMSRGIDPDVANPDECHSHPDVPDAWPSQRELHAYVAETRQKILQHGRLGECSTDMEAMRRVVLAVEHDMMHLETLQYMRAQQVRFTVPFSPLCCAAMYAA